MLFLFATMASRSLFQGKRATALDLLRGGIDDELTARMQYREVLAVR